MSARIVGYFGMTSALFCVRVIGRPTLFELASGIYQDGGGRGRARI